MIVLEEWPGGEMALLQTELVPPLVPGLQHPRQSSSSVAAPAPWWLTNSCLRKQHRPMRTKSGLHSEAGRPADLPSVSSEFLSLGSLGTAPGTEAAG